MVTNRKPLNRKLANRMSPRAVEIFRQMMAMEADESNPEWRRLDWELHDELKLKPGCCPAVVFPGERLTHPRGSAAGQWQRVGGPRLVQALAEAAGITL